MKTQSYQERVRAMAEKMAKDVFPRHIMSKICSWYNFPGRFDLIERYKGDARIAVAERAEGFRQGWFAAVGDTPEERDQCEATMKEQGLIPDQGPDKEDGKDGL